MEWLEQKYTMLVSYRLRNYKRKSSQLYNFSCPFCGDSIKNSHKARAYIYNRSGNTLFHCHNCGVTKSFDNFLKEIDYQMFSEFSLEKLKENHKQKDFVNTITEYNEKNVGKVKTRLYGGDEHLKKLKKISQLPHDHPYKKYVDNRKIPTPFQNRFYYCPKFFSWVNSIIPGKFSKDVLEYDESRLLIPFFKNGKMHAFQGRSMKKESKSRYITIVVDDTIPCVYGLDLVHFNTKTYVLEGPIDSTFLPNAIATAGGDLVSTIKDLPKQNVVVVYDNESRSQTTIKKIDKAILNGYKVCVWPSNLKYKDVNDCIMGGMSPDMVKHIIDTHTYKDLAAKMALKSWGKV